LKQDIEQIGSEISKREADLTILSNIENKKEQIKKMQEMINNIKSELGGLMQTRVELEKLINKNLNIEEKCEELRIEVQEVSLLKKEIDFSSEVSFKQRELERSKISLKQIFREEEENYLEIEELKKVLNKKQDLLEKKKKQEEELSKNFQKFLSERDGYQEKIRGNEREILEKQNLVYNSEQKINDLKIEKARFAAIIENLESEMENFKEVEIIRTSKESLVEKLSRAQEIILKIGSVNLRSLEIYDSIKKEYDLINEKVSIVDKEKQGILKIIHEIDIKKKKTFFQTFNSLNEIFSRIFSQLSTKGNVSLELEDRKNPFEGGVGIFVKTGHGKYFDVTSLSGGEQTLVALSLIFAIQELRPYYFYILDEIDAALDKRNASRLAEFLKKYAQKGQYVVISHNDEIITNAATLFGVSMHEGISKLTTLRV